ncbi:hypothetical protein TH53_04935 [Pedobacter lusitanus]|uniref:Lipid/polyisoprenoid-binding YceI-like domain-containing protein n=1 Tax=Pedobacter lusitanus TaxID=1503925 RepID=A0A0D0F912_9SPHI|nr:hypothetical protein TH53_04935 [Pedobacter lusitanus]
MKQAYLLICLCLFNIHAHAQDILISKNAAVSFFSSTVMEDIEGKSNTASSVINAKSREIIFKVSNTSFQFKKKLMQEHFNENYMESDRFPFSKFSGKITDDIDLSKDGNYTVNVEGSLDIHGVAKPYQCKVNLVIAQGNITAKTTFKVKIEDHQIKVPSLVFKNIAEFVDVRLSAVYQPKKT